MRFTLEEPLDLEYRVYLNSTVAALVEDRAIVTPDVAPSAARPGEPFLEIGGLKIRAKTYDDIHFVDEIFYKKAYSIISSNETCFIDVGMNVGLATLLFAKMPNVVEVHAFEPFPDTYERALSNLQLNPELAGKVTTYPIGLAAGDDQVSVQVEDGVIESGGRNLRSDHGNRP